jgi:hypothetical protein
MIPPNSAPLFASELLEKEVCANVDFTICFCQNADLSYGVRGAAVLFPVYRIHGRHLPKRVV